MVGRSTCTSPLSSLCSYWRTSWSAAAARRIRYKLNGKSPRGIPPHGSLLIPSTRFILSKSNIRQAILSIFYHYQGSFLTLDVMETPMHPRARISAVIRQHYREEARRGGENNDLWLSAWSKAQSTNTRFHLGTLSADDLDWDLHDLWYLFYEASGTLAGCSFILHGPG